MPVNLLPVLIPLLVIWGAGVFFLFRWRRWSGGLFVVLSFVFLVVTLVNTNVEKRFEEQMPYKIIEIGEYRTLQFTNRRGDIFTGGTAALVERMKRTHPTTVQVDMVGWYDFGNLRAYRVYRVDGDLQ